MKAILFILIIASFSFYDVNAQQKNVIDDEAKVPEYKLPDVLTRFKGGKVKTAKVWFKKQRPDILKKFTDEVYGRVPGKLDAPEVKVWETSSEAINGLAMRKQLSLFYKKGDRNLEISVLMYLPKSAQKAPVFLAYNFSGNHTVNNDPNIRLTESWVNDNPSVGIINNRVTEQSRGSASDSWPIETMIKAGYGLVTVYYGDVDPDKNDLSDGIEPFFYQANQVRPKYDEWGSIAAWGWGLSQVMDYLEKDDHVDSSTLR